MASKAKGVEAGPGSAKQAAAMARIDEVKKQVLAAFAAGERLSPNTIKAIEGMSGTSAYEVLAAARRNVVNGDGSLTNLGRLLRRIHRRAPGAALEAAAALADSHRAATLAFAGTRPFRRGRLRRTWLEAAPPEVAGLLEGKVAVQFVRKSRDLKFAATKTEVTPAELLAVATRRHRAGGVVVTVHPVAGELVNGRPAVRIGPAHTELGWLGNTGGLPSIDPSDAIAAAADAAIVAVETQLDQAPDQAPEWPEVRAIFTEIDFRYMMENGVERTEAAELAAFHQVRAWQGQRRPAAWPTAPNVIETFGKTTFAMADVAGAIACVGQEGWDQFVADFVWAEAKAVNRRAGTVSMPAAFLASCDDAIGVEVDISAWRGRVDASGDVDPLAGRVHILDECADAGVDGDWSWDFGPPVRGTGWTRGLAAG